MLVTNGGLTLFDVGCDLVERNLDEHELATELPKKPSCVVRCVLMRLMGGSGPPVGFMGSGVEYAPGVVCHVPDSTLCIMHLDFCSFASELAC